MCPPTTRSILYRDRRTARGYFGLCGWHFPAWQQRYTRAVEQDSGGGKGLDACHAHYANIH